MREDVLALRVAARFIQADALTKQWLMGVKRGWAAIIKSPHETSDKYNAITEFLRNLGDQVLFQKHGINIVFTGSKERAKFESLLAGTKEQVLGIYTEYEKVANNYRDVSSERDVFLSEIEDRTGDNIRKLHGADEFIRRYPEYKPYHEKWIKAMDAIDQYRWHPEIVWAPATRIFDVLMKHLYADAKATAEYRKEHGEDLIDDFYSTVPKEFDLNGTKVIVIDDSVTRSDVRDYVKYINRAQQLLKGKGFGKLWYGVVFVEAKNHKKTPEEVELAQKWGYSSSGDAGEYDHDRDQVYVKNEPGGFVTSIVIHELGHRYWFKFMTPSNRALFNSLVRTKATDKFRDYPQGPIDEIGNPKPVAPFGDYANSNIEEAFAEVFEGYVFGRDLSRDQLESFRSVLSSVEDPVVDTVARRYSSIITESRVQSAGSIVGATIL
jgi:hypothetical protein